MHDADQRAGAAAAALLLAVVLTLAGCASSPKTSADGVPADAPTDLLATPDAIPKIEVIKPGGANKPYEVLGRNYTPQTRDVPISEKGIASWYGRKFHGRRTASGEVYNMYAMTAAHPTMPLPSYARVRNPANGREVVVRVNDRGPFHAGRIIDLSYAAAVKLGVQRGVAPVEVERITNDAIRSGAWKREGDAEPAVAVAVAAIAPAAPAAPSAPAAPTPAAVAVPARGYWVQLGAFRELGGAENFQQHISTELEWLAPLMAVFADASLFRLQAGPYPTRSDAQGAAQRVREALSLVPVVVERR